MELEEILEDPKLENLDGSQPEESKYLQRLPDDFKPQTMFQDKIDNSEKPFEHRLTFKYNQIVPLSQDASQNPYDFEIQNFAFLEHQMQARCVDSIRFAHSQPLCNTTAIGRNSLDLCGHR
jgi:hypothetical protein